MQKVTVAKDGSGDFLTIQEALNQVRVLPLEPVTIFVKKGIYQERVTVPDNKPTIKIIGECINETIITNQYYAEMLDENNEKLGTFRTASVYIHANDCTIENITIENTAGYGPEIGQALALYVSGDRCAYQGVRLLGNQDTLYTARGRHYFNNCYIEGHVDFIFGSATAVFEQCEIHSLRNGFITAASTPKDENFGYVFLDCKLTGKAQAETVFLGRPWRPYASTVFIRTWMGAHINQQGWDNWRDEANERTVNYAEYQSFGPGASEKRVSWSTFLTEIDQYTLDKIFMKQDKWMPMVKKEVDPY